jgi:hypothetical protein
MEPTEINYSTVLADLDGYKLWGSSTPAAEAYASVMKEIAKMTATERSTAFGKRGTHMQMTAGDILERLYAYEYRAMVYPDNAVASSKWEYDYLVQLLSMSDVLTIRPVPKTGSIPQEAVLRFKDFDEISTDANVLEISMDSFADKGKKVLGFDISDTIGVGTYQNVLFVESMKEYPERSIPFLYTKTIKGYNSETSIFESPKVFNDSRETWQIYLKKKTNYKQ